MVMAPSAINVQEQYPAVLDSSHYGAIKLNGLDSRPNGGQAHGKELIRAALKKRVETINNETCEPGDEDSFYVADMGDVYRQHLKWKRKLGNIKPHYAVKCNNDPLVLRLLAELGAGFDCASKAEIDQVLSMGVHPDRIIYAQPCKTKSYIRYAAQVGVRQMTFDNTDELYKIKKDFADAELYLRISTDDSASLCRLSLKFGAPMDTTQGLLELAKELGLNVVGVAFHVGSGSSDPNAYTTAIQEARLVFDQAESLGFKMHTLDIGGGFVSEIFDEAAATISRAVKQYFPPSVRLIAEPGRYYVSSAFTIACTVIARRTVEDPELKTKSYMLYLNDGVYSSFSSIIFDHQHPVPQMLKCGSSYPVLNDEDTDGYHSVNGGPAIEYSIWGPTCDGIDKISERATFGRAINVSDWLFFEDMGAYTTASCTKFNGFAAEHEVVYVSSEPGASALLKDFQKM